MKEDKLKTSLNLKPRIHEGKEYYNIYIHIGNYSFELVPHCRTIKEKAMFYRQLLKSEIM